jgi:drug/metabolite transporter (DMT)-like permease
VSHSARVWIALGTVYVLWGSTYLGIELAGETIPPLFAAGTRFTAAGLLMAVLTAWGRGLRALRIRPVELGSAVLVGSLLTGSNAVLFVAERHVAIGLSALIVGSVPLWVVLLRTVTGERPPAAALAGVLAGFGGLALLVRPGGRASLVWLLLVVLVAAMWAFGSFLSRRVPLPRDVFAAASLEMLAGVAILLPLGALTTHPHLGDVSARSVFGWTYLVTFGSIVGFTAYVWLLDNAPIGKVATYAYVNPVVAIVLGALVLHESLTWSIVVGAVVVLASVALVVRRESVPPEAEAVPAGAAARAK